MRFFRNLGFNRFSALPTEGLHHLVSLKVHENSNLKKFPARSLLPRVRRLALSYAYHCCAFQPRPETEPDDHIWSQWNSRKVHEKVTWIGRLDSAGNSNGSRHRRSLLTSTNVVAPFTGPVHCIPQPGPFLPCEDLFDYWALRCGVWLVFLLALFGNALVITVLCFGRSKLDVPRFLVANLAFADFLMGVYLCILALVDAGTLGIFRRYAVAWQHSALCSLAGLLAVFSTELSVYTLAVLTLERHYAITHAMHLNKRLSLRRAGFIMAFGHVFALAAAVSPLFGLSSYSRFAVCLPFEVRTSSSLSYVLTLVTLNGAAFVVLIGCYLRMYCAIRGSQAWHSNDSRIARRMALLVFTDLFCWAPIAVCTFSSLLFDYHLISLSQAKVFTIFVLPLNACADPFLYAIFTKQFKQDCVWLCKRLEESRVSRGIGACRHSSNFSARHTPAGSPGLINAGECPACPGLCSSPIVRLQCTAVERQRLLQRLASAQPLLCRCSARQTLSRDPLLEQLLVNHALGVSSFRGLGTSSSSWSCDQLHSKRNNALGRLRHTFVQWIGRWNQGWAQKLSSSTTSRHSTNVVIDKRHASNNAPTGQDLYDVCDSCDGQCACQRSGAIMSHDAIKCAVNNSNSDDSQRRLDSVSSSDQFSSDSWKACRVPSHHLHHHQMRLWEQLYTSDGVNLNEPADEPIDSNEKEKAEQMGNLVREAMLSSYMKASVGERKRSCSSTSASASCSTTTFRMSRSSISSDGGGGGSGRTTIGACALHRSGHRSDISAIGTMTTDTSSSLDGNGSASIGEDSSESRSAQERLVGALLQQFLCDDCSIRKRDLAEQRLLGRAMGRLNEALQEDELRDEEVFINSNGK